MRKKSSTSSSQSSTPPTPEPEAAQRLAPLFHRMCGVCQQAVTIETEADVLNGVITRLRNDGWLWGGHAWICPDCAKLRAE